MWSKKKDIFIRIIPLQRISSGKVAQRLIRAHTHISRLRSLEKVEKSPLCLSLCGKPVFKATRSTVVLSERHCRTLYDVCVCVRVYAVSLSVLLDGAERISSLLITLFIRRVSLNSCRPAGCSGGKKPR